MKPDNARIFRPDIVVCVALSSVLLFTGCAPITPLPGGGASIPAPSSSGGSSGGGSPSAGGSSGGGTSTPGGGLPGGGLPGGGLPGGGLPGGSESGSGEPGGSGTVPGGSGDSTGNGGSGEGGGPETDPTWEVPEGSSGDGGWQTSNDIPEASSGDGEGGAEGNTEASTDDVDAELEGALEDLDGEILAEREIIRTSSNAPGGGLEIPVTGDSGGADGEAQTGGIPAPRSIPPAPPPPRRGSEGVPDDIPDAKDDDIIARQLREAAMQEQDPELKEKLWEEYRKYKKG